MSAPGESEAGRVPGGSPRARRLRRFHIVPLVVFAGLAVAFAAGLTMNPREIPSVLVGKPVPEFALPPVDRQALGFSAADLKGEVRLVNVFASWCAACEEEHPLLTRLAAAGTVPIYGLNYKDDPEDARRWLNRLGNPYARIGADRDGRVAIDWGVYGVPETFVVDRQGRIAYKHIGALKEGVLKERIMPLIARLRAPRQ